MTVLYTTGPLRRSALVWRDFGPALVEARAFRSEEEAYLPRGMSLLVAEIILFRLVQLQLQFRWAQNIVGFQKLLLSVDKTGGNSKH